MQIENILIEYLPRLKCANFFILFDRNFDDVSSVRIHLRPTEILVRFENDHSTTIDLASLAVRIQINSLSLLIAKNNLISFRINIASSFREEMLPMDGALELGSMKKLTLSITPDTDFSIICDNCSGPLSGALRFQRILELPSESMDSNEWFCHKPEATSCNGHSALPGRSQLRPAESDLFYGNFFALIHHTHITNIQVNAQQGMAHCKRCLNHIGESVNGTVLKIWNGNVRIKLNDSIDRLFTHSDGMFRNFLVIIDRLSYDYQILGRQTMKFLFEARSSKGTTFLFIQTMARNLEIYQMNRETESSNRTTMNRVDGVKCLFLCEENTDPALIEFWQKDVNVICAQISIGMLEAVADHLHLLSKYVPEQFRMNNGFCLSYLSYTVNSWISIYFVLFKTLLNTIWFNMIVTERLVEDFSK